MTLPGETIGTGASPRCPDCDRMPALGVYMSAAGYYIGTYCNCGPYSRESGYYRTREAARRALEVEGYGERDTEYAGLEQTTLLSRCQGCGSDSGHHHGCYLA